MHSLGFAEDVAEHVAHAYGDRCFDVIALCFKVGYAIRHHHLRYSDFGD